MIDHHKTNAGFGDILYRALSGDGAAYNGACGRAGRVPLMQIRQNACMLLFLTDTGRFAYSGVTEQTMRAAGRLYGFGIDTADIARQLFFGADAEQDKAAGQGAGAAGDRF